MAESRGSANYQSLYQVDEEGHRGRYNSDSLATILRAGLENDAEGGKEFTKTVEREQKESKEGEKGGTPGATDY